MHNCDTAPRHQCANLHFPEVTLPIRLFDISFSKQGMEVSLFKWKIPGLGEGRELGTSHTWAVWPAGRRWKAGDWQPGFYSQPALGSPFSWEAGHRGRAGRGHGPSGVCFASSRLVLARASPACGRLTGESGASAPAWASGWGCQPQEAVLPGPRGGAPDGEQEERSPRCPRPSPCWPQGAEVVSHCPLLPLQPDPDV